jgi:hypothetical protein
MMCVRQTLILERSVLRRETRNLFSVFKTLRRYNYIDVVDLKINILSTLLGPQPSLQHSSSAINQSNAGPYTSMGKMIMQ